MEDRRTPAPPLAHTAIEQTHGVNFYRRDAFDVRNRTLVDACRRGDREFVVRHIATQDAAHPEPFDDERFDNRVGMQLIHTALANQPRRTILDVACGNGELLRRLAAAGHDVAGVDVSPVRIDRNRVDLPRLQLGLAEQVPFPSSSFDVVIAQECLEHVMDLDRALQEVRRVLVDGGIFLCQVPNGRFADGENHVRLFDVDLLRWCCESVGFETVSLTLIPYLRGEVPNNLFYVGRKRV